LGPLSIHLVTIFMSHSILEIQRFVVYGDFSEHVLVLKALMEEIYLIISQEIKASILGKS
jgi:hypothetical protein